MHRHRDKNGAAPFIGNSETASQNEQRYERREMCVCSRKEQRVYCNSEKSAEITFDDPIEEKPEKKLLNHWSNGYRKHDYHDPLFDRLRAAEEFDDVLLAGTAAEKALCKRAG